MTPSIAVLPLRFSSKSLSSKQSMRRQSFITRRQLCSEKPPDADFPPIQSFRDAKLVCVIETSKLWEIAAPIAFNILCNYGVNSFTSIFVGHIGDLELSAVAIALSVVSNFSLVSCWEWRVRWKLYAGKRLERDKWICQEPEIAEISGRFTTQIIPQMFALAINFPTQKFLQSQSKVGIMAWIGWCKDGWRGLSWLAFKDVWPFLKLSFASAVMLCLEIWYFMTIIVLTGHLEDPVIAVGSLSICMNINGWEGMLFIGINAAISVRVSNELGSGHPRAAKYSVIVTSEEMRKAVADLAYLLGINDDSQQFTTGYIRCAVGGGWQAPVAYINLFCYYAFGLPLGFLLGYKTRLGVQGIWIGMICGTSLQTLILLYMIT
ncbi:unnamed protein product [Arabidopsis arenosa]|uniref:MATE efflux family protein n=1 Tax=Arabidopsis arenosa TaxID=38785 RepID=A0A8S2ANK5_ARAAE|nr:unnamed protein product [Arabidopsis arenosa]